MEPLLGTGHFRVLIGDDEVGFSEVGRLTSESAASHERGQAFGTVVLRRALSKSRDLFEWRRKVVAGEDDRRDVVILQLDGAGGHAVNAWRLVRAWPCRWSGPAFDAREAGIAFEEIELAFEDVIWEPQREGA